MAKRPESKLLIVYNADSGFFNTVASSIHKALSPETYACQLCRLTYGMTHMVEAWKSYLEALPIAVRALHRNEFQAQFPALQASALPAIFLVHIGRVDVLLSAETIQATGEIPLLIERLNTAMVASGLSVES